MEVNSPISIFLRSNVTDMIQFKGSLYAASGGGSSSVLRVAFDPQTGLPVSVPFHSPSQAFSFTIFKDPTGKTPDQLLVGTSAGALKVEGDKLVPVLGASPEKTAPTFFLLQSKKTPERVFVGPADGVSSMRWDGRAWIDEGRLPNIVYGTRNVAEDGQGALWASGGDNGVLRVDVAASGMRDSKAQFISQKEGLPSHREWKALRSVFAQHGR